MKSGDDQKAGISCLQGLPSAGAQPSDSLQGSGVLQPAAAGCTKDADASQGSGVPQPADTKRSNGVGALQGSGGSQHATAKMTSRRPNSALQAESSAAHKSAASAPAKKNDDDDQKVMLLGLKRPHYDAIKNRRKLWEGRPLFEGECRGRRPSIFDKLAQVGRVVVLQSGANTNDRVRIAEVRRYTPQGLSYPLQEMVAELGADLLPDVADGRARAEVYESLYGIERCARGFVAMRLEWPNEAAAATNSQGTSAAVDATHQFAKEARATLGW